VRPSAPPRAARPPRGLWRCWAAARIAGGCDGVPLCGAHTRGRTAAAPPARLGALGGGHLDRISSQGSRALASSVTCPRHSCDRMGPKHKATAVLQGMAMLSTNALLAIPEAADLIVDQGRAELAG
jgi:hypothetical protein